MITYRAGDATEPGGKRPIIIAHVCNDEGGWGAGFVLAISQRWLMPELRYRRWFKAETDEVEMWGECALGRVQIVDVINGLKVANMVAQSGFRRRENKTPLQLGALEQCLRNVARRAVVLGASVAMPRIGCGLGGSSWKEVEPAITATIVAAGVNVTVYDLPGKV